MSGHLRGHLLGRQGWRHEDCHDARPDARREDRRRARVGSVVAAVLLVIFAFAGASPAVAAGTPGTDQGTDSLRLLAGTYWLGPGAGTFRLRLGLHVSHAASETVTPILYGPLSSRSQFDIAKTGEEVDFLYQGLSEPVTKLHHDPAGGYDLDISVNGPASVDRPDSVALSRTGIYPVQVLLEDEGVRMAPPLTTFLVYAGADAASFPRLRLAIVLPSLDDVTGTATGLAPDASMLASRPVPLTFGVGAPELSALASGSAAQRTALVNLRAAVAGGDEVLPTTSIPVNLGSLVASGLGADIQRLVTEGAGVVAQNLGQQPSATAWAFPGGVDPRTLQQLQVLGATRIVVPGASLSGLPAAFQNLTFAEPSRLRTPGTVQLAVYGSDPGLSAQLAPTSPRADWPLLARQFLAEAAMIDLEEPSDSRGVVVMPPAGARVPLGFLRQVLAGLQHDPLLQAVTVDDAFDRVPVAIWNGSPLVRELVRGRAPRPLAGIGQLGAARQAVSAAGQVFGVHSAFINALSAKLVDSLASYLNGAQRARVIGGVYDEARGQLGKLRLPAGATLTLTSLRGSVPLTLLSSSSAPARVRLVMTSEQLSFQAKRFNVGECRPVGFGSEDCQLRLAHPTTVLEIPISVRTPGVFQLSLRLLTADGRTQITASTETVRSTAFPDIGLVLIIGAALFLAVWWVRNARHGRRARQLVPPVADFEGADDEGGHGADPAVPPGPEAALGPEGPE